jgi:hypothetical protein
MSEMIERVAKAIYEADGFCLGGWSVDKAWPADREDVRAKYRQLACTAIAAMRDPTDAMADAPDVYAGLDDEYGLTRRQTIPVWQAMVDQALKNG